MSTAAVFLHTEKAFDKTWHSGLLHKLSELQFSIGLIKVISPFFTDRKFSLGRRRIFYVKKNSGRGGSKFNPRPNIV
jgi:hypothetical protein